MTYIYFSIDFQQDYTKIRETQQQRRPVNENKRCQSAARLKTARSDTPESHRVASVNNFNCSYKI